MPIVKGPWVKRIQSALVAMGHEIKIDAVFGQQTAKAFTKYYRDLTGEEYTFKGFYDGVGEEGTEFLKLDHKIGGGIFEDNVEDPPVFVHRERTTPITQIVLHESVTWTAAAAVRVLVARGLGVNYVVDTDAVTTQHLSDYVYSFHAGNPYNKRSISIEVINRYYGHYASEDHQTISGVWVDIARGKNPKKLYIVPPLDQLEEVNRLVCDLLNRYPKIPQDFSHRFPSGGEQFYWGRWGAGSSAGVVAHHRWAHADALFPEHYLHCRFLGLSPENAYDATLTSASSGKRRTALPRRS